MGWGKLACFIAGSLFGSAGITLLTSKDTKKVYAHTTAATLKENAQDILAVTMHSMTNMLEYVFTKPSRLFRRDGFLMHRFYR